MPDNQSSETSDTPDVPSSGTVPQKSPPVHLLGDAAAGADTRPPQAPSFGSSERYELLEEIARGGMGIVFRARDRVLDREVGLKTLLDVPPEGSVMASRFRAEALITSQLQHPNIPPVHDLGTLPDGRPFLAMKLIKGRTLDAMLKKRPDPSHDRGRFISVFEQIAQGVAYAHAHRVVHRDLKPANVMVGDYGEVQVMDWGLAKVLAEASATTVAPSVTETDAVTEIRPSRHGSDETRAGSIFGTPAYMPREQAIGAVGQIDTRSDVFSLGGVLCAVLTGRPPYLGGDAESTRQVAAVAKLDDAFARLDACGAELELIALCKRCLAPERDDRPRDADEVAKAVGRFRAEAERRARQAELEHVRAEGERAKAELRATEQRKRRRVQLAFLGSVMMLGTGIAGFAWWQDNQAAKRKLADEQARGERLRIEASAQAEQARLAGQLDEQARSKGAQARQGVNADLNLAVSLRTQYRFGDAAAALVQAENLARAGAPERLREVEQAQRNLAFVKQLDDIRYRKWAFIPLPGAKGYFNTQIAPAEYRKVFAGFGLDLTTLDPTGAAERIAASDVKADLVAAVDDWSLYERNESVRTRLLDIATRADRGRWTDRLRDPSVRSDKAALAKLAAEADPERTPSAALGVLAELMERNGLNPSPLLTAARARHPSDFQLAFALGRWFGTRGNKDGQEIGPYEAARALRPENLVVWNNLGTALYRKGDVDGAIAAYKEVLRLDPEYALAHTNLGFALLTDKGDVDGAIAECREAIRLDPQFAPSYTNLGLALYRKRDLDGAVAEYRRSLRLDPKNAQTHSNLGVVLMDKGDVKQAIAAFEEALRHDPGHDQAHYNLGVALREQGDVDGAIAHWKEAIRADPNLTLAHYNLGSALLDKGDIDGAVRALKEAVRSDPRDASSHYNLGNALLRKGDLDGALDAFKETVRLDPRHANAHGNIGFVLQAKGKLDEAIAEWKAAIRVDPKHVNSHSSLGTALLSKGDLDGAIAAYREAARLDPNNPRRKQTLDRLLKLKDKRAAPVAPAPHEVKQP